LVLKMRSEEEIYGALKEGRTLVARDASGGGDGYVWEAVSYAPSLKRGVILTCTDPKGGEGFSVVPESRAETVRRMLEAAPLEAWKEG
jgi:hypothetical protein